MENKVKYEQIENANGEIKTTDIKGKGYAQVNERIKAYRKVYPTGSIETEIQDLKDDYVRMRTVVTDENDKIIATGTASETNNGKNKINLTSMIENCETSAVGRALGFAGFGVDSSIASAEDIEKSNSKNDYEIFKDMYIKDFQAKEIVKNTIKDLMRKLGIVKDELNKWLIDNIWSGLPDLNLQQYLRLEDVLRTANNTNSKMHELYGQNIKYKKVLVPENQQIDYESSLEKFGRLAIKVAGNDETLINEIIDYYFDAGINLSKYVGE